MQRSSEEENMKRIQSLILGLVLACLGTTVAFAQAGTSAGEDIKDAGKATKHAAKKTGSAVKKGSKKAVNKTAEKTEAGAAKVKKSTQP
jgi:hypothetical protein